MKLFYTPRTCALAVHLLLAELGLAYEAEAVDLATRRTASGRSLDELNPKGKVPFLLTGDGELLTEATVILCRLAESAGRFMPERHTRQYWQVREWLSYLSTELHGLFGQLFMPGTPADTAVAARALLERKFAFIESSLQPSQYLAGDGLSVADLYLHVLTRWAGMLELPLGPKLSALHDAIARRPAAQRALREQGIAGEERDMTALYLFLKRCRRAAPPAPEASR